MTTNEPLVEITTALTELSVAAWRLTSTGTIISAQYYCIHNIKSLEDTLGEIKRAKQALNRSERKIKQTIKKASA